MKYIYIGGFPPPYGGVTIKNQLLFSELSKYIDISQSDFYDKDKSLITRVIFLLAMLTNKKKYGLIIGVSKDSLKKLTHLLYVINRQIMRKSIVMVMGGTASQMIAEDINLQTRIKEYKHIYVETNSMKQVLKSVDINNVSVFPNCRVRPRSNVVAMENNSHLRCVFFSLISKDKGADIIIEAANLLNQQDIYCYVDFYGHIEAKYKSEFEASLNSNKRIRYCGVFKSIGEDDVYEKLRQYDVLLFPTRWKNEGVPGILVESKIASLPAIVSDINYNAEIVEDGVSGIVLHENNADKLAKALIEVNAHRTWLQDMKFNAYNSAEYYYMDRHLGNIVKCL